VFPFFPEVPEPSPEPTAVPAEAPDQETRESQTQEPTEDRASLDKIVQDLNKRLGDFNVRLNFELYEGTDMLYVRLVDRRTNSVVKTLPPEKMLDLQRRISSNVGLLLDENT
jgi:flagellar protein FlaG